MFRNASPVLFAILVAAISAWSAPGFAQTPTTMDICPNSFSSIPMDTPPITCGCSAEAAKKNDTVWGANPYYYGSSICRAAVHAGAITMQGGQVTITPAPKIPFFPSVTRNDVQSSSSSADNGFRVVVAGSASGSAPAAPAASTAAGQTMEICPNSFSSIPMDAPPITCGCSTEVAKKDDTIWGANPYYYGSSICRAAVHTGAITPQGGQVTVAPAPKIPFFPAVTRNGVQSSSSSADNGFRVVAAGQSDSPTPSTNGSGELTMEICPNRYNSIPMDTPPITCGCSAETAKRNDTVWGANPYYYASSICRAAVHAGAIGAQGGQVTVTPAPKVPFFPAVTKNGVASSSASADNGFRIMVSAAVPSTSPPAAPAVDATGKPIQAPIAETLKSVGRVQVYINFATASDRIEPSSAAVLGELLTTLRNAPALRIELVGHTDSQGSAPYNLDLSHRRAASVYAWLAQRGVDRERLRSSGRGLLEPIADNDSEQGRALNRRVEVKAVN